jgi:multiple sugar transport system permease protein
MVAVTGDHLVRVTATSARAQRAPRRSSWRRHLIAYVLIAPAVLLVPGMIAFPLVVELGQSLTDVTVSSPGHFVGLGEYALVLHSPVFWNAVWNTFWLAAVSTFLQLILGFLMACLLFGQLPGRSVALILFLLPWLLPAVLSAIALHLMLNPEVYVTDWLWLNRLSSGLANTLLAVWPMLRMILISVWRGTSFFGIFLLAGLNRIPSALLDFADLEGVDGWNRFRLVYLPLLRPTIVLALVLSLTSTLSDFTNQWLLSGGREVTNIVGTLAFEVGLTLGQYGQAAATSLTMLPVTVVLVLILLRHLEGEAW